MIDNAKLARDLEVVVQVLDGLRKMEAWSVVVGACSQGFGMATEVVDVERAADRLGRRLHSIKLAAAAQGTT